MKIIAGIYKGFKLFPFPGNKIRPTPSLVREAIFDIIGAKVINSDFLDLFAGTGAVGIEAISRGAKSVTFIEIDKKAIVLIKNNLTKLNQSNYSKIIKLDYLKALNLLSLNYAKFDIIFLDPPYYNKSYISKALQLIDQVNIVKDGGIIIAQHPTHIVLQDSFNSIFCIKEKKYGKSRITIFSKK